MNRKSLLTTKNMVTLGVLTALAVVLIVFTRFSPMAAVPFYVYEAGDVPMLIAAYVFGPVAGLIIAVLVSALQALTFDAGSGLYGFIMHVLASGVLITVSSLAYKLLRGKIKTAIMPLVLSALFGIVAMTVVMVGANIVVVPLFMHMPVKAILPYILPFTIPFNLLKAGVNSVLAIIIYIPLSKYVKTLI